jgi:hypothetical protein
VEIDFPFATAYQPTTPFRTTAAALPQSVQPFLSFPLSPLLLPAAQAGRQAGRQAGSFSFVCRKLPTRQAGRRRLRQFVECFHVAPLYAITVASSSYYCTFANSFVRSLPPFLLLLPHSSCCCCCRLPPSLTRPSLPLPPPQRREGGVALATAAGDGEREEEEEVGQQIWGTLLPSSVELLPACLTAKGQTRKLANAANAQFK